MSSLQPFNRRRVMAPVLPENSIQVTATRTSVTATAAMPVTSDVVVTLRLETNYKVCEVTIQAGNTTGTASVQPSSIVRHCLITVAPAKDSSWAYVLDNDTVDIPLYPRNILTTTVTSSSNTLTVVAAHPVSSPVTVTYRRLGVTPATDLCSVTIPVGQTTASVTYTPSYSARQVSVLVNPALDEDYEYSPEVNLLQIPAKKITILHSATPTQITSRTSNYSNVFSDVIITFRLRGTTTVLATLTIPAGSNSGSVEIEPASVARETEIGWSPDHDSYTSYTMSYNLTIPAQN